MRGLALLLSTLFLGAAIGLAQTLWHFGALNASLRTVAVEFAVESIDDHWTLPKDGRRPRAVFDAEDYDFGVMEFGDTSRRAFTLKNDGDYPLVVAKADSSCTCTLANIAEDAIAPGQTAQVELEWTARVSPTTGDRFRHWAKLQTNDPDRPLITLTVHGRLTAPVAAVPPVVTLTRLAKSQTATAQIRLYAYRGNDELKVTKVELLSATTAAQFDVTPKNGPPPDVAENRAKSGCLVDVVVRPGLPIGAFRQVVRLHTNIPDVEPLDVAIVGEIGPDVRLVGREYNERTGVLRLNPFDSAQGTTRDLELWIFGRQDATFEPKVVRAEPDGLRVSFGEKAYDAAIGAHKVKVQLVVPPAAITRDALPRSGIVEIDTGHNDVPRLNVPIDFVSR
jgi:anti-sigma-K factor RskA